VQVLAAVATEVGAPLHLEQVELAEPRSDEALVRLAATGVCHTDLSVRDGQLGFGLPGILGHEGAGVVEVVGDAVRHVEPGDHVVLSYSYCRSCRHCLRGRPTCCSEFRARNFGGSRPDGSPTVLRDGSPLAGGFFGQSSFATYSLVGASSLVKVPRHVPFHLLAPLGCAVQTGAGTVLNTLRPEPGAALMVFGAGAVGLSAVMAGALAGCDPVVAVDVRADRLRLAQDVGATHVLRADEDELHDGLAEVLPEGADFCVDATGNPQAFRAAFDSLGTGGTLAMVGASPAGTQAAVDIGALLSRRRRIVGVSEGDSVPQLFVPQLVRLYEQGKLPLHRLVRTYPFSEINTAVDDAARGATVKPVVTFAAVERT